MNQHNSWMATMRKYGSCVLAKFNFILKIASFFGILPCSIEEKSVWKAKSAPFCHSSWFIWVLLVHSGCVYSIWLLINKAKDEFTFFDYFAAFFKDSPTMLDKLTLGWPIIMTYSIQGGPPKSIHFCWATARPVSTRARSSVSQIKRTLQEFRTRGWVTRSDNFGAR